MLKRIICRLLDHDCKTTITTHHSEEYCEKVFDSQQSLISHQSNVIRLGDDALQLSQELVELLQKQLQMKDELIFRQEKLLLRCKLTRDV